MVGVSATMVCDWTRLCSGAVEEVGRWSAARPGEVAWAADPGLAAAATEGAKSEGATTADEADNNFSAAFLAFFAAFWTAILSNISSVDTNEEKQNNGGMSFLTHKWDVILSILNTNLQGTVGPRIDVHE